MKSCENHNESVVVFNGDSCPLCKAERKLKNIWAEVEKSMAIMKQIQKTAEEAGLKIGQRVQHYPATPEGSVQERDPFSAPLA